MDKSEFIQRAAIAAAGEIGSQSNIVPDGAGGVSYATFIFPPEIVADRAWRIAKALGQKFFETESP